METNRLKSVMEAILFASGEPVSLDRLAEVLNVSKEETIKMSERLAGEYDERESGMKLVRLDDSLQLCTRPEYFDWVREIMDIRRNAPLSQAAFEVLAVVAYNQPVTKSFIEQVRGVDCSGVVSSLCEKGLLEEKGRLDLPGRPLVYGTTKDFLRCFSLSDLEDLPPVPEPVSSEPEEEETQKG